MSTFAEVVGGIIAVLYVLIIAGFFVGEFVSLFLPSRTSGMHN